MHRIVMMSDMMANFQQRNCELTHCGSTVSGDVGYWDTLLFCADAVYHIISCGQNADIFY